MKDSTAYMLAEMLKGTFKAYGSAYGHGVSGVNMGAKTGTGTYGAEIYSQYNLPDNAAKDVWINGFSPQYTMSVWMGFKIRLIMVASTKMMTNKLVQLS